MNLRRKICLVISLIRERFIITLLKVLISTSLPSCIRLMEIIVRCISRNTFIIALEVGRGMLLLLLLLLSYHARLHRIS